MVKSYLGKVGLPGFEQRVTHPPLEVAPVQFYLGSHFPSLALAARQSGKMNHLKVHMQNVPHVAKDCNIFKGL